MIRDHHHDKTVAEVHPTGGGLPEGQTFHAAGASEGGWTIVAVHNSKEAWEEFRDGALIPRMQQGIDSHEGGLRAKTAPRERVVVGVELREAGITAPILVMGGYYGGAYPELLARRLTPVVYELGQVEGFARLARSDEFDAPVTVHLKIDTGMHRVGADPAEASEPTPPCSWRASRRCAPRSPRSVSHHR